MGITGSPPEAVPKQGSCRLGSGSVHGGCWVLLLQGRRFSTLGIAEQPWGWGTRCGSLAWPWVPSVGHGGLSGSAAVPAMP